MNNTTNTSKSISNNAMEMICDQHINKLSIDDKQILELLDWQSLVSFSLVNKSCNQRLSKLISYNKPQVEKFIDLRISSTIQNCLSANFKNTSFVNKAIELVRRFYETAPRGIEEVKYGAAFSMVPELLHYAMFLAKNETVLEIAGASGENAALLGFSGANRVYLNDIVPAEVESFKKLCRTLPLEVQEKMEPVLGNCFDLLQLKPELKGNVGLVLCYNLLHFFNDQEQANFMELLKKTLKPGGRAILTANACYVAPDNKDMYERYPENTAWMNVLCYLHDYSYRSIPADTLFHSLAVSDLSKVSLDYQQYYLWLKDSTTNYKWVENKAIYKALPPEIAEKLEQVVNKNLSKIKNLSTGSFRVVTSTFNLFQERNFAAIFEKAGFEVEKTFLIRNNGHLFLENDPHGKVTKVGIIIKAPSKGF